MAHSHALPRSASHGRRSARLLERGLLAAVVLAIGAITLTAIGNELAARFLQVGGRL